MARQRRREFPGKTEHSMTLDEIRAQIDETDRMIRGLFEKRMGLVSLVAKVKAETSDRIYKPEREKTVIEKQSAGMPAELLLPYRGFLRSVMRVSREYQYGKLQNSEGPGGETEVSVSFRVRADDLHVLLGMIRDFGYSVKECRIEGEKKEGCGVYAAARLVLAKTGNTGADTFRPMLYALSEESEDFQLL